MSQDIFSARVVDQKVNGSSGLICIEEIDSPIVCNVASYAVRSLSYTELDCRKIFRNIVVCVQKLHNAGIAHRNLNLNNFVLDPFVCSQVESDPLINGCRISPSYFSYSHRERLA
jgi:serine/threonine protein kinase